MDTNERLRGVIATIGRLMRHLIEENTRLKSLRPGAIADLQDEKVKLVRAYEEHINWLGDNPAMLEDADSSLKERLRQTAEELVGVMVENVRAIGAAKAANERLVSAISNAVAEKRAALQPYAPAGPGVGRQQRPGPVLSLALDRRF